MNANKKKSLRNLLGVLYQVLGAHGASDEVLDVVLSAANGEPFTDPSSLLPYCPPEEDGEEDVVHLLRFMCSTWNLVDNWAYSDTGEAIVTYPVIQGTANQIAIGRIASQPYDHALAKRALDRLSLISSPMTDRPAVSFRHIKISMIVSYITKNAHSSLARGRARFTPASIWTSADMLSSEFNLPAEELVSFIRQDGTIVEASNLESETGNPLFTTKDLYESQAGLLAKAISAVTGKIVG